MDREATIRQFMHDDSNLSDFEKQLVYETIERDDKYLFALRCWTARMENIRSHIPAVIVFAKDRILIIPFLKNGGFPFEYAYYSQISDARMKKGIFSYKLKLYAEKKRLGVILDSRYPGVVKHMADFIRKRTDLA